MSRRRCKRVKVHSESEPFRFSEEERTMSEYTLNENENFEEFVNSELATRLLNKHGYVLVRFSSFNADISSSNPTLLKLLQMANGFKLSDIDEGHDVAGDGETGSVAHLYYKRVARHIYEKGVILAKNGETLGPLLTKNRFNVPPYSGDPVSYAELFFSQLEQANMKLHAYYLVMTRSIRLPAEDSMPLDIDKLSTPLQANERVGRCPGLSNPYVYCSGPFSNFENHVEDLSLNSISFNLCGDVKFWLISAERFSAKIRMEVQLALEKATGHRVPLCILQHRQYFFHPDFFRERKIKFQYVIHEAGSAVVTGYDAVHSGVNLGTGIAKAKNVILRNYLENFNPNMIQCDCRTNKAGVIRIPRMEMEQFGREIGATSVWMRGDGSDADEEEEVVPTPETTGCVPREESLDATINSCGDDSNSTSDTDDDGRTVRRDEIVENIHETIVQDGKTTRTTRTIVRRIPVAVQSKVETRADGSSITYFTRTPGARASGKSYAIRVLGSGEDPPLESRPGGELTCKYCGKDFKTKQGLHAHVKVHKGETSTFRCAIGNCSATYRSKGNLTEHQNASHFNVRYKCSFCEKDYASKSKQRKHEADKHGN